jgi:glutamate-1-semialdehyde 2,1-aminomutase
VLSTAAAVETLRILLESDPYPELARRTMRLVGELRALGSSKGLAVDHVGGSLFQLRFGPSVAIGSLAQYVEHSDVARLTTFLDALQDCGVRPTSRGLCFVSAAHDDAVVDETLERMASALAMM